MRNLILILTLILLTLDSKPVDEILDLSNFFKGNPYKPINNIPESEFLENEYFYCFKVCSDVVFYNYADDSVSMSYLFNNRFLVDECLHEKILEDFNILGNYELFTLEIYFDLDSSISFDNVNFIINELRKIQLNRINFIVNENNIIGQKFPPLNFTLDSAIMAILYDDLKFIIENKREYPLDTLEKMYSDSALTATIGNEVTFFDCDQKEVTDLYTFIEEKKELFIFYTTEPNLTYQGYVRFLEQVYCTYQDIRASYILSTNDSIKNARRIFPIRCLDISQSNL